MRLVREFVLVLMFSRRVVGQGVLPPLTAAANSSSAQGTNTTRS